MIPNYERKLQVIEKLQNGRCAIGADEGLTLPITELHHRLHNTKTNRKKYPNFIDSIFNLVGVNHDKHMERPSFGKIPLQTAELIENVVLSEDNPIMLKWVIDPFPASYITPYLFIGLLNTLGIKLEVHNERRPSRE